MWILSGGKSVALESLTIMFSINISNKKTENPTLYLQAYNDGNISEGRDETYKYRDKFLLPTLCTT